MADLDFLQRSNPVQIVGEGEGFSADVVDDRDGKKILVLSTEDGVENIVTGERISTTTPSMAKVGASNLLNRKAIEIYNTGTLTIFVGNSNVTTSGTNRGRPVSPESNFYIQASSNCDIYVVSSNNNPYVVTEVS